MEVISDTSRDREQAHAIGTPSRAPNNQTMRVTDTQKQALIDNLQLEGKPLSLKQVMERVKTERLSSHGTSTEAQNAIFLTSTKSTNESGAQSQPDTYCN